MSVPHHSIFPLSEGKRVYLSLFPSFIKKGKKSVPLIVCSLSIMVGKMCAHPTLFIPFKDGIYL